MDKRQINIRRIEWRSLDFLGYPNYLVSDNGRIKNIEKDRVLKNTLHLDVKKGNNRYRTYVVILNHNGKVRQFGVSRLMGLAFIPNPNNHKIIDHINRNSLDNRVDNLRWVDITTNNRNSDKYDNSRNYYKRYNRYIVKHCNIVYGRYSKEEDAKARVLELRRIGIK